MSQVTKESILAYNSLSSADAALERAIAVGGECDPVLSQIRYAIADARHRLTGFAFPELFPREMPHCEPSKADK